MESKFSLAEHFISINGEGQRAGELALFLRFTGCNLRCAWCDTLWAVDHDAPHEDVSLDELLDIARQAYGQCVKNVTLTGGEPLLQKDIAGLIKELLHIGLRVEVETNGAVDISPFICDGRPVFTMDYKLPSSGMEKTMMTANLALLTESDTLKFVCASHKDLDRAYEIIQKYAPVCRVYLSPVFGNIEPAEIVEFMKDKQLGEVRLQLQLHKFIWDPQKRGV
ncbi:putative 7-carboxy-7-deazaguanine synthase QueE [uncultured Ruminococcus sp.]|uniref:putative 7-carboxy-7-deazaguanine synthase QueE n=1 Tax=uncultured Ruminococcus sp. TaxID=165186 RepID=UPI0025DBA2AD|nr:putative 7-carboxy-7-deazaguanine synthase QueE [uncultured Ruminococcus sp.]